MPPQRRSQGPSTSPSSRSSTRDKQPTARARAAARARGGAGREEAEEEEREREEAPPPSQSSSPSLSLPPPSSSQSRHNESNVMTYRRIDNERQTQDRREDRTQLKKIDTQDAAARAELFETIAKDAEDDAAHRREDQQQ